MDNVLQYRVQIGPGYQGIFDALLENHGGIADCPRFVVASRYVKRIDRDIVIP